MESIDKSVEDIATGIPASFRRIKIRTSYDSQGDKEDNYSNRINHGISKQTFSQRQVKIEMDEEEFPLPPRDPLPPPQDEAETIILSSDDEAIEMIDFKKTKARLKSSNKKSPNYFSPSKTKYYIQDASGDHRQNICKYCGRKLTTMKALAEHIQKQHLYPSGASSFKCETCGKELKSEHSLAIHKVTHSDDRPYNCKLCKTKYKSQFYLDRHYKSKGHINVESVCGTDVYINNGSISEGSTGTREDESETWSPSPPPLSPEIYPTGMGTPISSPKKKGVVSSPSVASKGTSASFSGTKSLSEKVNKASPGTSKMTQNQSQEEQIQFMDMANTNGVMGSYMQPVQAATNPVMFYGYMMPPNGATGNAYATPIQQTASPYIMQAGNYDYVPTMLPQGQMQQVNYQSPSQAFHGQNQQNCLLSCLECQAHFYVDAHLRSHMRDFHQDKCWKCPECSEVMLSPGEFKQHFSQCRK